MPRYQIENEEILFRWLAREPDGSRRLTMIDWFVELSENPKGVGQRLPQVKAPVYLARTPVWGVTLTYLVADQYRTIRLIRFGQLP